MGKHTSLYERHIAAGAKMVDFGGWDMPIHYGSQLDEHRAVRSDQGIFDVSHMTIVDIVGRDVESYLQRLLSNDIAKLHSTGMALYSAMLNEKGGTLDDLIVYRLDEGFRLVVNCATREKDLAWLAAVATDFQVTIEERPNLGILAIQGPSSISTLQGLLGSEVAALKPFTATLIDGVFVARTGYTGEKGFELILPADLAVTMWQRLMDQGCRPIGLGARDTLRLEAGMNLYGQDMNESVTPLESNMSMAVALDNRDFIGSDALRQQLASGVRYQLMGMVMTVKGVLRAHYPVYTDDTLAGEITSGAFSPSLQHSIALARVDTTKSGALSVEIRGRRHPLAQVTVPFVRNGKQRYKPV
jgi:aminomethyltransferase